MMIAMTMELQDVEESFPRTCWADMILEHLALKARVPAVEYVK